MTVSRLSRNCPNCRRYRRRFSWDIMHLIDRASVLQRSIARLTKIRISWICSFLRTLDKRGILVRATASAKRRTDAVTSLQTFPREYKRSASSLRSSSDWRLHLAHWQNCSLYLQTQSNSMCSRLRCRIVLIHVHKLKYPRVNSHTVTANFKSRAFFFLDSPSRRICDETACTVRVARIFKQIIARSAFCLTSGKCGAFLIMQRNNNLAHGALGHALVDLSNDRYLGAARFRVI